jgi:hypothetical protein
VADDTILSLFDYSGIWSQPYEDAGYHVIRIDTKLGTDIYDFDPSDLGHVHGVLAAPPCTDFAVSGARWFKEKDADGRTQASVKLVLKTLGIINYLTPAWWALENPVGRIHKLIPQLGKPKLIFQPYEFGDPYRKRTCIWGAFNNDLKRNVVEPQGVRKGQPDAWYSKVGGKSEKTKEYRSMTSPGFAKAFYEANP